MEAFPLSNCLLHILSSSSRVVHLSFKSLFSLVSWNQTTTKTYKRIQQIHPSSLHTPRHLKTIWKGLVQGSIFSLEIQIKSGLFWHTDWILYSNLVLCLVFDLKGIHQKNFSHRFFFLKTEATQTKQYNISIILDADSIFCVNCSNERKSNKLHVLLHSDPSGQN